MSCCWFVCLRVKLPGKPEEVRRTKSVGLIAGGTGLTPMYQIISAILNNEEDDTQVTLLYANQVSHTLYEGQGYTTLPSVTSKVTNSSHFLGGYIVGVIYIRRCSFVVGVVYVRTFWVCVT